MFAKTAVIPSAASCRVVARQSPGTQPIPSWSQMPANSPGRGPCSIASTRMSSRRCEVASSHASLKRPASSAAPIGFDSPSARWNSTLAIATPGGAAGSSSAVCKVSQMQSSAPFSE